MIRVSIAGLGNCAGALVEGLSFYKHGRSQEAIGLLFEHLGGYDVRDIEVVSAFDISEVKVGRSIGEAIYQKPNAFNSVPLVRVDAPGPVFRGPTLDGNPPHLQRFVRESPTPAIDVPASLRELRTDILVNLLPTGSASATEFYTNAALSAGCSFINCIPTPIAQRPEIQSKYKESGLVLLGDDIKSQMGTTIIHRALLDLLQRRGAQLRSTSQINVGGKSKLVSKMKSLAQYGDGTSIHVGHHYDLTRGTLKTAFIDIEATVFGGSVVRLSTRLDSDDKPNSAGSLVDLIRIAMAAKTSGANGVIAEACALYMKSPPNPMDDVRALGLVQKNWAGLPLRSGR